MKDSIPLFVIIAILLTVTQMFSFIPLYDHALWNFISFAAFFIFAIIAVRVNGRRIMPFVGSIKLILISLFLSSIPAYFDFGQSFADSFKAVLILSIGYVFYFYLHHQNVKESTIVKSLLIFSLCYTCIEILQQMEIIQPAFSIRGKEIVEGGTLHERFGFVRYQVRGVGILMLTMVFYTDKFFNGEKKIVCGAILLLIISGIYIYGARKLFYVVTAIVAAGAFFSNKTNRRRNITYVILALAFIIYNFYADYSLESADLTARQMDDGGDFIRIVSAQYFINSFSDSILYPILGSGIAWGGTPLHQELTKLAEIGFYQADSGIIGYYSKTGLLGVLSVLSIFYYLFKYRNQISLKYKTYLLSSLLIIVFDFWAIIPEGVVCMSLCLYLCDKSIETHSTVSV